MRTVSEAFPEASSGTSPSFSWAATLPSYLIPLPLGSRGQPLGGALPEPPDADRDRWYVIAPLRARLHPDFVSILRRATRKRPDLDLVYGDEAVAGGKGAGRDNNGPGGDEAGGDDTEGDEAAAGGDRLGFLLKPVANLPLLIAQDYVGTPLMVRAAAFHRLGGLDPEAGAAVAYDLVLRAMSAGMGIGRIPRVLLFHPGARPAPGREERRAVLERWIARSAHLLEIADGLTPDTLQLRRRFDGELPDVTLVVPTRRSVPDAAEANASPAPHIQNFLESLCRTDWPMERLHVLVGDDAAGEAPYAARSWPFRLRVVPTARPAGEPFNYAAKMNRLWRMADTEQIVLMNDDIVVGDPNWLRALLTFSMEENVGGAGARLLYPDGRVQHAGMAGGIAGTLAHAWLYQPADAPTYGDWALVHRDWSMVTGAVFATRRGVLRAVNGFDEAFSLEFNDVDLCLRMGVLGYRIVYTPFAEMAHHEKASRGATLPAGSQVSLFVRRWGTLLADDPAYHPMLSRGSLSPVPEVEAEDWLRS